MANTPALEDVLFDQMEFLLAVRVKHIGSSGGDCACDDCLRFCRVYEILMAPFGEKAEVVAKSNQRKSQKAGG